MSPSKLFLLAFLSFLMTANLAAQKNQLSLSGTIGNANGGYNPNSKYYYFGTALGYEATLSKHFTVGLDVDWQRFGSESEIAEPLTASGQPLVPYYVLQHQINLRPTVRFYLNQAFRGLYVGVFGAYSYLTIKTSGYPENASYLPDIYTDPSDHSGGGFGVTYGYRLKINPSVRITLFGSHQLVSNQIPDYEQGNNQLGLGLNWLF